MVNWSAIRPLNGGRDKGFEELCAQIARAEIPSDARFERKGTPDAGVECYAVLNNGSEWAWQAKYFDTLGDSQWSQIDKSVRTAIMKHPRLVQYYICVPLDRPDARIDGRKSAKEKWNEHVDRWKNSASKDGMTVEFIYWGSHELLERLTRSVHVGRLRFWFDLRGFDAAWFTARLEEALRTAGPRYTPEVHVDLPIALQLNDFGRTEDFFNRQKVHACLVREKMEIFKRSELTKNTLVDTTVASVCTKIEAVLKTMGAINVQPTGPLPFKALAKSLLENVTEAEELSRLLTEGERQFEKENEPFKKPTDRFIQNNPFRNLRHRLAGIKSALRTAHASFVHADEIAGCKLLLLNGDGGTGKTHLLCDVVRQRVEAGQPTVLLMGQQFVSQQAPWTQALHQMDLASHTAEDFVGALEAAAQAANCRALFVIDAINEGAGQLIWPSHLAAFLVHLERSPWVGVVLSIRSPFEEIIIPAGVRTGATTVTHHGFIDCEYDATKVFFLHYDLELPSTPLLAPEFRNPLFLKTLCQGLCGKGERRLPRGFSGITAVFDLYIGAINERVASSIGFDARVPLLRQALESVADEIVSSGRNCLTLEQAKKIVNDHLPGRDFERSLYRSLVVEGALVEITQKRDASMEVVVLLGYERFSDHLAAKTLLDRHLDEDDPSSAFAQGGPLAFLSDKKTNVPPGLLEALSIQIPERTGKELMAIAPNCVHVWGMAEAFRRSLVWRARTAFFDGTKSALNQLCQSEYDLHETIDVLLTVASIPEHPLNAKFLDKKLRKDTMPDRDAWWSVYLHQAWGTHSAVDRLVDWAHSLDADSAIDDEAIELCSTVLTWMLTTSNKFLRDRATKSLVNLLTGRLAFMANLIERFAEVDDLYISERVFAVAYGVAMRSSDAVGVGNLASCVHSRVFALGSPPPHILLRDYARGVVERAIYLGSTIDVDPNLARPPYQSEWPSIPTEEDVKTLLPDWSKGSYDSGELEWGRNRIGSSVMIGDFARYVIGTNSSSTSRHWLSLTLEEPPWNPPPDPKEQLDSLVSEFSADERKAWDTFENQDNAFLLSRHLRVDFGPCEHSEMQDKARKHETMNDEWNKAVATFKGVLIEEHAKRLEEILKARETYRKAPRLDLRQIQRYILKRVFDMGWTVERFGRFDRFLVGYPNQEGSKGERIGKKYQWIAYHEILAYISDRFQYLDRFSEQDKTYEGPWKMRDIDPSCTITSVPGGTSFRGHVASWRGSAHYDEWGDSLDHCDWVLKSDDLPNVEDLLVVTDKANGIRWLNGCGYFHWSQKPLDDHQWTDVERRELWYICTGYLIRATDAKSFLNWSETVDFSGRWMPDAPEVHRMFLGEHGWSPASRYFRNHHYEGWTEPGHDCPVKIKTLAIKYLQEGTGFDRSVDEGFTLRLPAIELVTGLGIQWNGRDACFIDSAGNIVSQDPTTQADGPSALLLRIDLLEQYLDHHELTICWTVVGEKRLLSPGSGDGPYPPELRMSGAYLLSDGRAQGFLKRTLYDPQKHKHGHSNGLEQIDIIRSPDQQKLD